VFDETRGASVVAGSGSNSTQEADRPVAARREGRPPMPCWCEPITTSPRRRASTDFKGLTRRSAFQSLLQFPRTLVIDMSVDTMKRLFEA